MLCTITSVRKTRAPLVYIFSVKLPQSPLQRKHELVGLMWVTAHDAEPVVAVGDFLRRPHEGSDLVAAFQRLSDHFTACAAGGTEDE